MRLVIGLLTGLTLAGASACGGAAPEESASPAASGQAGDSRTVCAIVIRASRTALDSLAPVSVTLADSKISAGDIAVASDGLKAAFTAMHLDVAAAAQQADDPDLRIRLTAYQMAVEQAIVVVEGADGDPAVLASAIALPAIASAENEVMAACSS